MSDPEPRKPYKRQQQLADAEHLLENLMHRRYWTPDVRDELADYLADVVADAPRGGRIRKGSRNHQRRGLEGSGNRNRTVAS